MRTGSAKMFLLVLCLAVCVGMCRPSVPATAPVAGGAATAPAPATAATQKSESFTQWAYDKVAS